MTAVSLEFPPLFSITLLDQGVDSNRHGLWGEAFLVNYGKLLPGRFVIRDWHCQASAKAHTLSGDPTPNPGSPLIELLLILFAVIACSLAQTK